MDDVAVLIAQTCENAHDDLPDPPARARNADLARRFAIFSAPLAIPDSRGKVITIASRFDEIVKVRRAIRALVINADLPRETVELVELVTGELVANAVDHGSGSLIDASLRIVGKSVLVAVTNDGKAFERTTADLSAMIYAERGRGLAILTAMGCTLAIEQTDPARCTVTATIPLN